MAPDQGIWRSAVQCKFEPRKGIDITHIDVGVFSF